MTGSENTCDYVARKEDPSNWHGDHPNDWLLEAEAPTGLELAVWECPHDALNGQEYCVFHTDPEDVPDHVDEGERFVEAVNEVSAVDDEKMARQRKEFVGATFGAFDIAESTLDAGDEHPIRLDHATFARGVNAEKAIFEHSIFARGTRFETGDGELTGEIEQVSFEFAEFAEGKVSFKLADFGEGKVSFNGTNFGEGTVLFSGADFGEGEVLFRKAKFGEGEVSFGGAEFGGAKFGKGRVSFGGVRFGKGRVSFNSTEFGEGEVSFYRATFGKGEVSFNLAEFGEGEVSFKSTEFGEGKVTFNWPEFGEGKVSFRNVEFSGGDVSFFRARFGEGKVSFRNAEFGEGEVSFKRAKFGGGMVSFDSAIIAAALLFVDTRFDLESTLSFSDAEFRGEVVFDFGDDDSVPYMLLSFDFSGATFRRTLEFRGRTNSTTRTEQSGAESQFDFVFGGDVDFSNVTFPDGVDLSTTRFPSDADFADATLEDADFSDSDMTGTDDISTASFDGANLTGANFTRATLAGASFERARLSRTELLGANFAGTKLYGALLGDARINRETEFWLAEDDTRCEPDDSPSPVRALRRIKTTFRERKPYSPYDPRYCGSDGNPNLEKAGAVYTTLEILARNNSLPELASKCFLGRKDVQFREYWRDGNTIMIIRSLVPNLVARYGESPARVLGTGVATVLTFGLAYDTFDLIEHAESGDPVTSFEGLYFSALTFTTLGYGDFNPANSAGQVLAVVETSMGVILLAILVFVFGRRATR